MKRRRIDIFGHQTSLALEPEYWDWMKEIMAKTGASLRDVVEVVAVTRSLDRSLASELRVAITAYFHGNPYPIYRCPDQIVPARDGSVYLLPPGRRRAQEGLRSRVDQLRSTGKPRSASRSPKAL
jgi:predicted DNA-binding ribbon-helix-helix protein